MKNYCYRIKVVISMAIMYMIFITISSTPSLHRFIILTSVTSVTTILFIRDVITYSSQRKLNITDGSVY